MATLGVGSEQRVSTDQSLPVEVRSLANINGVRLEVDGIGGRPGPARQGGADALTDIRGFTYQEETTLKASVLREVSTALAARRVPLLPVVGGEPDTPRLNVVVHWWRVGDANLWTVSANARLLERARLLRDPHALVWAEDEYAGSSVSGYSTRPGLEDTIIRLAVSVVARFSSLYERAHS